MNTLYYTKGLPASGKTTCARNMVKEALYRGTFVVRSNRDDVRSMLGVTTGQHEPTVSDVQDAIIRAGLERGWDVIVDDTNFYKGTEKRFRGLAADNGANVAVIDFTDVPVETCIERDKHREASVGEDVIRSMAERYLGGGK